MIIYLIKSTFCLAMFFAFYRLVLERENMHLLNRFYLLGSICFALCIPFIEVEIKKETDPFSAHTTLQGLVVNEPVEKRIQTAFDEPEAIAAIELGDLFDEFIFAVYILVASILAFRFVKNIWHLYYVISKNEQVAYRKARLVLINENVLPHTFLNYILISKADYLGQRIEEPLLRHELTHARQRHSIDILCLELLLIVFWFHPLLYLYKRAIKLNHEFLVDAGAICANVTISDYQNLLLNKVFSNNASHLTSQLNYLLTRKRLSMMTRQTSPLRAFIIKAALIPLCIGMVFTLATRTIAQQKPSPQKPTTPQTVNSKPTPAQDKK